MITQINENLQQFPALAIELSQEQIEQSAQMQVFNFSGLTAHQKEACRIAGARLGWHPQYIAETASAKRPALFRSVTCTHWQKLAQAWQQEHDMSVEELASVYADRFEPVGDRLYEPISWQEGVRISAHDQFAGKHPCPLLEW